MFDYYYWDDDFGTSYVYNVSIEEAVEATKTYEEVTVETSCLGTIVCDDGEWLYSPEEAVRIATEEENAREEAAAEEEAARQAERNTFGDAEDEANIAFIKSICAKYPARDYGARNAGEEIGRNEGWSNHPTWKGTEAEVWKGNRKYRIEMWRGATTIRREETIY